MTHGLTPKHLEIIREIVKPFASQIEQVELFGSRAKGTQKDYSDIDLVFYGDLDETDASRLQTLFQDSALPFKVDVKIYNLIGYLPLKEHIDQVAEILFTSPQLRDAIPKDCC